MVGSCSNKSLGRGPSGETELAIFPENSWVNYVNDCVYVGVGREIVPKIGRGGCSYVGRTGNSGHFLVKCVVTGGRVGKIGMVVVHQARTVDHRSGRPSCCLVTR